MRQIWGTDYITGLNVARASHKIEPGELTVSDNGWTDEEGVWRVAPGPTTLYTGYSNIKAMAAGRMGGADHVVWLDGSTLYDNGTSAGTLATDSDVTIKDFNDEFFILGATDGKNYIYDGSHLREAGAWQPDYSSSVGVFSFVDVRDRSGTSNGITGVTAGTTTTLTIGAHSIAAGDWVYIDDMLGMTELDGKVWQVDSVTATEIILGVDSTDFSSYTSGGDVYPYSAGLVGTYKFYYTCIVKLGDDSVLEGKPRGLRSVGKGDESNEPESFTLAAKDSLTIELREFFDFEIDGVAGTDYTPGFRVYRTKNGGSDFWLDQEYYLGSGVGSGTSGGETYYYLILSSFGSGNDHFSTDSALGAVYTPGTTDRSSHPQSSLITLAAQRLWMNDEDNPNYLWYTSLDGVEYVPALNFLTFPDTITAIGSAGDAVIVFSGDRMWRVTIYGGVPDVDEIQTPVGTTYGDALTLTDLGLLFLRDDGLWTTDGASPPQIVSRRAFASLSSPACIASYGDTLILCGGTKAYVMRRRDDGIYWHEHGATYTMVDATNGTFYAADANSIYTLFTGVRAAGTWESPTIIIPGNMRHKSIRLVVDVEGDSSPTFLINGNVDSDYDGHQEDGTGRRLARVSVPRLLNHTFTVRGEMSGDAALYGYWLEVE